MALTCCASKMHCPTIERRPNLSDISNWDKHMFGQVVGLKVVIPEANGGSSM